MYEYQPKETKKREKSIVGITLLLGSFCFGVSRIAEIALPFLYQLLAVLFFSAAVVVAVRYLMRSYRYRLEETDRGVDFTVTEQSGKRIQTVCRISVDEIRKICAASSMSRGDRKRFVGKRLLYPYVASIRPADLVYLLIESNGTQYLIKICADQGLIDRINHYKGQYLSDNNLSLS